VQYAKTYNLGYKEELLEKQALTFIIYFILLTLTVFAVFSEL